MIGLNDPNATPPPPPSRAPRLASRIFSEGGVLHTGLNLEHRPQQDSMARGVARAMADDVPLIFEAGTGTGKSLAYLLPGIIHAVGQKRQMIVSTHTIALQEQLDQKDIPLCRKVFKSSPELAEYVGFKSAVLVGKSNYLCTTRLAAALQDKQELIPTHEHAELQRIAEWALNSKDGLRHELRPPVPPEIWELVSADSSQCARKYCDCEKCFYQKARARIREADVVIVNHSLLFALLNAGSAMEKGTSRGVLFPDDFLVLDEAHTVPDVATDHFGLRLSSYGVERMLKFLYNPKTRKGLLQKFGSPESRQLVVDSLEASGHFFAHLLETQLQKQAIVRVRQEGIAQPWLDGPLTALHKEVRTLADRLDEGKEREQLLEQATRVKSCQTSLRQFLNLADNEAVYWVERSGKRQAIVTLRSAPIDIAPHLREALLECHTSVVFTSATLATGGHLEPFQQRIGGPHVEAKLVASPFDFARNMRVFAASDVPLPSAREARLCLDTLADYIRYCTLRTAGGSLVLFTSYNDMREIARTLEPIYREEGRPFLMQGEEMSRTELSHQMRERGNAILFGTDSFWTGIDVPGDALSQVILTRLPFEVPTHPVLEARADWIRERGGNPFNDLTLPDALIKFRQGIGRLIRSANDQGTITLLDSRLLSKAYGKLFFASLPNQDVEVMTKANRDDVYRPFKPCLPKS